MSRYWIDNLHNLVFVTNTNIIRTANIITSEIDPMHLYQQFGEVETMSFADVTKTAIVQYKSRKDAEQVRKVVIFVIL